MGRHPLLVADLLSHSLLRCPECPYIRRRSVGRQSSLLVRYLPYRSCLESPFVFCDVPSETLTISAKALVRTLTAVREALAAGELVCLFPEGAPSRTGNTLRFGRGLNLL